MAEDATKICDFFDQGARRHPDTPFLIFGEDETTYGVAQRRSAAIARLLITKGFSGKPVALASPNHPAMLLALLGLNRAGCTWVPINPLETPADAARQCRRAGAALLLYHSASAPIAAALDIPTLQIDGDGLDTSGIDDSPFSTPRRASDLSDICFTGGTTGEPKLIPTTNRVNEAMVATMLMCFRPRPGDRFLVVTPFTHAAGAAALPFMVEGGAIAFTPDSRPATILACIERHRITHVFLPPTLIYGMLSAPELDGADTSSLRGIIYGAAPIAEDKLLAALRRFGPIFHQCYGQSEAAMICTHLSPDDHARASSGERPDLLRSAGRPTPLMQVEIMDEEGRLLGPGEKGEVVVRGALVVPGYLGDDQATKAARAHGWHHTGDIGFKDAADYLFIVDRKKDMIISGGLNIFPSDIEQALMAHPDVASCAAIGVPDDKWGEAAVAVVMLRPDASADAEALRLFAREALGSVRAPKRIEIRAELPLTKVGKIDKQAIRAGFWAGHERRVG